jgi:cob(I)alamin adenosyltransferase
MTIYTRSGDGGETSLGNGTRVSKSSARVEAYGSVDEAGCAIGAARAAVTDPTIGDLLRFLQQRLMNCASALASPGVPGAPAIEQADVDALESAIDRFVTRTGPFTGFVLESGSQAATHLQVARAVTRRAERRVVELAATEPVPPLVAMFLNRASDALYAAARLANLMDGFAEESWDPTAPRPE